jgi:hypothetical protein
MANFVELFTQKDNNGQGLAIQTNTPILPPAYDAKAESLFVDLYAVPLYFFSGQNYTGQRITITQGGGSNDLSTLPGNWSNKIRSVLFTRNLSSEEEDEGVQLKG